MNSARKNSPTQVRGGSNPREVKRTRSQTIAKVTITPSIAPGIPTSIPPNMRWEKEVVLAEARAITKQMTTDNPIRLRTALADLLLKAGWNDEEFIDALCQDVMQKGPKKV